MCFNTVFSSPNCLEPKCHDMERNLNGEARAATTCLLRFRANKVKAKLGGSYVKGVSFVPSHKDMCETHARTVAHTSYV